MEAETTLQEPAVFWRELCFGTNPTKTLVRVGVWAVASILFFHHLLMPIQVVGLSMTPTYSNGSMNFINKLSYVRHAPERGDIIALSTSDELLLKRIVALPGETVRIVNGAVEVNGKPLQDQFSKVQIPSTYKPIVLGSNEFFVIGDNRQSSVFLPITRDQILGKIVF